MGRKASNVRVRKDGRLEKRFTADNGKRYSIYAKTSKELGRKEQALRNEIAQGTYTLNQKVTLDRYFQEWMAEKKKHVKPNTLRHYQVLYKTHIASVLGSEQIRKIEKRQVMQLQNKLIAKGLSPSAVNNIMVELSSILRDAVRNEVIQKNPCNSVRNLSNENTARETIHRALTIEEQAAFMQEAKSEYLYEFFAILLLTGMRSGEAAALTWKDIDYKNNVIHVSKTITHKQDVSIDIGPPKTKTSKRDIPMTEQIRTVLQMQMGKSGRAFSLEDSFIVFPSVHNRYINNCSVNAAIRNVLRRLEEKGTHIEYFSAHAFRDTFATRFIEQGGKPQTLKTILGHSTLAMTMDLYAHVLPNTKQEEMDSLNIAI